MYERLLFKCQDTVVTNAITLSKINKTPTVLKAIFSSLIISSLHFQKPAHPGESRGPPLGLVQYLRWIPAFAGMSGVWGKGMSRVLGFVFFSSHLSIISALLRPGGTRGQTFSLALIFTCIRIGPLAASNLSMPASTSALFVTVNASI